jgi:hypothetical protein
VPRLVIAAALVTSRGVGSVTSYARAVQMAATKSSCGPHHLEIALLIDELMNGNEAHRVDHPNHKVETLNTPSLWKSRSPGIGPGSASETSAKGRSSATRRMVDEV